MAENKKSFLMYCDFYYVFSELTNEEAGQLIKHVLSYVNDENPITENRIINIAFQPIKMQLKRDLTKWEDIIEKRSKAGQISADKRKQTKSTRVKSVQQNSTHSTVNVNDNVTVNVNYIFKGDIFKNKWNDWIFYKKNEKKETYKTAQSEQAALNKLYKLSNGNEEIAIEIIEESIANQWKGFFELKNKSNGTAKQINGSTGHGSKNDSAYEFLSKISKTE